MTVVVAVFWLSASAAWANGLSGMKSVLEGEDTDFSAVEKAIIHGAADMTRDTRMTDANWNTLSAEFSTELMVELVQAIAFYCGLVRFLNTLDIELEDEIKPWLARYPLPA